MVNVVDVHRFARLPALIEDAKREADGLVKAGSDKLSRTGHKALSEVIMGFPRRAISEYAKEWNAGLIMAGSHGHSAIGRFLLGSVAQGILRTAPCSVEIVRSAPSGPATRHGLRVASRHFLQQRARKRRDFLACAACDRRSGRHCFDTSTLPAIADWPMDIDSDVTSFAGGPGPPVVNLSIEQNSRPHTGPDRRIEDISVAPSRAPLRFRQSSGIGVVVDPHVYLVKLAKLIGEWVILPDGEIGRVNDHAREWVQGARSTNPDGSKFWTFAGMREQRINCCRNRAQAFRRIARRDHGSPALLANYTLSVYQARRDFGSANIYSKDKLGVALYSYPRFISRGVMQCTIPMNHQY